MKSCQLTAFHWVLNVKSVGYGVFLKRNATVSWELCNEIHITGLTQTSFSSRWQWSVVIGEDWKLPAFQTVSEPFDCEILRSFRWFSNFLDMKVRGSYVALTCYCNTPATATSEASVAILNVAPGFWMCMESGFRPWPFWEVFGSFLRTKRRLWMAWHKSASFGINHR